MAGKKTLWFSMRLPKRPLAIESPGLEIENAATEANFKRFVETHMKAYGEEADRKTIAMYKKDVREGVIDRDKMLIVLRKGAPLGCVSYEVLQTPEGEKYILMGNLGVAIRHQGKGIGKDLLCSVLNMLADDFGPGTLVLGDVNADEKAPQTILEQIGFKKTRPKAWFPFSP
jgi:ribosomal protein S18 acetylase RimI-like enzyme